MVIQIQCPKCGSQQWIVYGWTQPLIISGVRCAVCWYEENYVEPKERKVCSACDVEKNPKIGYEYPKIKMIKRCPKCKSKVYPLWDDKTEKIVFHCEKGDWSEEAKEN